MAIEIKFFEYYFIDFYGFVLKITANILNLTIDLLKDPFFNKKG